MFFLCVFFICVCICLCFCISEEVEYCKDCVLVGRWVSSTCALEVFRHVCPTIPAKMFMPGWREMSFYEISSYTYFYVHSSIHVNVESGISIKHLYCWASVAMKIMNLFYFKTNIMSYNIWHFVCSFDWGLQDDYQLSGWLSKVQLITDAQKGKSHRLHLFQNVSSSPNIPARSLLLFFLIFPLSFDFSYCPFMGDTCWQWNMETRLVQQRISISRFLTIKLV